MQKLVAKFNERGARQSNLCVCKFIFAKYGWFYMHKTCNEIFFDVFVLKYDWTFYRYACLPVLPYFLVKKLAG